MPPAAVAGRNRFASAASPPTYATSGVAIWIGRPAFASRGVRAVPMKSARAGGIPPAGRPRRGGEVRLVLRADGHDVRPPVVAHDFDPGDDGVGPGAVQGRAKGEPAGWVGIEPIGRVRLGARPRLPKGHEHLRVRREPGDPADGGSVLVRVPGRRDIARDPDERRPEVVKGIAEGRVVGVVSPVGEGPAEPVDNLAVMGWVDVDVNRRLRIIGPGAHTGRLTGGSAGRPRRPLA